MEPTKTKVTKNRRKATTTRRRAAAARVGKDPEGLMFADGRVVISDRTVIKKVRTKIGLTAQKAGARDKVVSALVTFRQGQPQDSDMVVDVRC